jgi:hypothetical protein
MNAQLTTTQPAKTKQPKKRLCIDCKTEIVFVLMTGRMGGSSSNLRGRTLCDDCRLKRMKAWGGK